MTIQGVLLGSKTGSHSAFNNPVQEQSQVQALSLQDALSRSEPRYDCSTPHAGPVSLPRRSLLHPLQRICQPLVWQAQLAQRVVEGSQALCVPGGQLLQHQLLHHGEKAGVADAGGGKRVRQVAHVVGLEGVQDGGGAGGQAGKEWLVAVLGCDSGKAGGGEK